MYVQTYNETIFPLGNHNDWDVLDKVKTRIIFIPNPTKKSGQPKEKISTKGENIQSTNAEDVKIMMIIIDHVQIQQL